MRVFLTGGTGPLGAELARLLRERGDEVRALVRRPDRAEGLRALGCELVQGDLSDEGALVAACRGAGAVLHAAAMDELGAPAERRDAMLDVNVRGTERVLGAALTAAAPLAVHVSTVAVFGDTRGVVVDEGHARAAGEYRSVHEQSRACGHRRAQEIAARGLPLVTVLPGAVYGPGEPGALGGLLERFLAGRLPVLPFPELGLSPVHRDDVADGVLRAMDKGVPGESYVLAGEPVRAREVLKELARASGRRAPVPLPSLLLKALAPAGRVAGPALGLPPDLRELVSASAGATAWASGDKAREQLGWTSRPLPEGLQQLVDSRS